MSYSRHLKRQQAQRPVYKTRKEIKQILLGKRYLAVTRGKQYTIFREVSHPSDYAISSFFGQITPFVSHYGGFHWEDVAELQTGIQTTEVKMKIFHSCTEASNFCKRMSGNNC